MDVRAILAAIVALHGAFHLLGTAKAFGWAELADLREPVSRRRGLWWFGAAALFWLAAILLFVGPSFPAREWWWTAALPGIVVSQILISRAWSDAKFGTLANAAILVPTIIATLGAMPSSYRAAYERETQQRLTRREARPVVDADLGELPPPVQKYLRFAGVVGRPPVTNFRVRFEGQLRDGPAAPWMPTTVEQYGFFHPVERVFFAQAARYGLPLDVLHVFAGSQATMRVKVGSLVEVVDASGPEMTQSETVTVFNDMWLLAPATLIDADVSWLDVSDRRVSAALTHAGHTVSAVVTFAEDGSLVNFESHDRYASDDGKTFHRWRWSTPVSRWGIVDGLRLPVASEARWTTPDAEFAYARFGITSMTYNVAPER